MPSTNSKIKFVHGTYAKYMSIADKDPSTLYFCDDTKQMFVGSAEYTKGTKVLDAAPTSSTVGNDGCLYAYNGNLYLCSANLDGSCTWTKVANVTTSVGVTSVGVGEGLSTTADSDNPITSTGTIVHATPEGAQTVTDTATDVEVALGESFDVQTVSTDKFGHVIGVHTHKVTLPNVDGTNTTYTIESGSAEGTIKVTPSNGTAYEVPITGWEDLAKSSDLNKIFKYKGTVATEAELPADAAEGDVYHVTESGEEFVYAVVDGNETATWESIGGIIDLSAYAKTADVMPRVSGATGQVAQFDEDGTLSSTGFTLGASVPANAKFTDTTYTHPTATAYTSGLYKVTVDSTGHIIAATPVTQADLTALGLVSATSATTIAASTTGNAATATSAASAQKDGDGNVITATYATKEEAAMVWEEM